MAGGSRTPSLAYLAEVSPHATYNPLDTEAPRPITIGLDPGGTTGVAVYEGIERIDSCQLNTKTLDKGIVELGQVIHGYYTGYAGERPRRPIRVVCEDYRVYSWHAEDHSWRELHTPKLIGVIHCLCHHLPGLTIHYQMAQHAKSFVDDKKLKDWDLYDVGLQHARDANRHALHYILFGRKPQPK